MQCKKRLLLSCIHHFKSELISNMDHVRISGTEPLSVILNQRCSIKELKINDQTKIADASYYNSYAKKIQKSIIQHCLILKQISILFQLLFLIYVSCCSFLVIQNKTEKVMWDIQVTKLRKSRQVIENWSKKSEHKQVSRGGGAHVRKGKRSFLACKFR